MKKYTLVALLVLACIGSWALSSSMKTPSGKVISSCPKNLAGKWTGKYFYKDKSSNNIPTNFTFFVDSVSENNFSGHIVEPRTNWGPENLKEFEASVDGNCEGTNINFVKTYKFPNGHSVNYSGKFAKSKINGKWAIGSNWGGIWNVEKK